MILKLIIFFIAIGWLLSSLVKYFLRSKLKRFVDQVNEAQRDQHRQSRRPRNGNVNVDYIPKNQKDKTSSSKNGGDYIDYEEVKD